MNISRLRLKYTGFGARPGKITSIFSMTDGNGKWRKATVGSSVIIFHSNTNYSWSFTLCVTDFRGAQSYLS